MDDQALPQRSGPDLPAQARRLLTEHYPQALGAVLGGSAARGQARATSDLDLAVLLPDTESSRREVIRHEGRLAELFLHAVGDIADVLEGDRAQRRATMLFVYGQGLVLLDPDGHVARVRDRARELLDAGPPALTPAEWERGRYLVTCFLDDLLDTRGDERHEQLATADLLLREASHLLTAHHGAWTGIGRWLPRRLLAADPQLGEALLTGRLAVAERGDPEPLAAAAEKVLDLVGGPLREGYVQLR
ncbi:nucleotidyltransferase domain-containing protein [Streptomyces sp. SID8379]|uniref:nucleotidyltransferase domain-containing protein n=1 Tax=unclassified Streptomyces TaxID=2593676 RepID=UPI00036C7166|nr:MULTISPECIES: nucleotidyltransferase domain-containing protein [unclassified Streptomyces]MYW68229.1 nucleotidyltransferase domain-containing protein [Streptomyces sp. SID8379]